MAKSPGLNTQFDAQTYQFETDAERRRYARVFLNGYIKPDAKGLYRRHYASSGSDAEVLGRRALVELLERGNLHRDISGALIELLVPNDDQRANDRKLEFKHRRRGAPQDAMAVSAIADAVRVEIYNGSNVEAAIDKTMSKFNISRDYAYRCWSKCKPVFEAMEADWQRQNSSKPK
ncbi:hypothetical protein KHC28_14225 [Ancylobacter sonchi]|uniref:hypothetical protein n=1 Tax=Ancylobacter sonchi TaxID=1937790 RepID=UPI001BD30DD4|nr:hypothetical protein [Ancylobacter sonchi]MBS7534816.1 hypothetical protein [Ancylobacter sonchi]